MDQKWIRLYLANTDPFKNGCICPYPGPTDWLGANSPSSITSDPSQMSTTTLYCVKSGPLPSSCYINAATPQAAAVPIHI